MCLCVNVFPVICAIHFPSITESGRRHPRWNLIARRGAFRQPHSPKNSKGAGKRFPGLPTLLTVQHDWAVNDSALRVRRSPCPLTPQMGLLFPSPNTREAFFNLKQLFMVCVSTTSISIENLYHNVRGEFSNKPFSSSCDIARINAQLSALAIKKGSSRLIAS